jgi:hypothetical protein
LTVSIQKDGSSQEQLRSVKLVARILYLNDIMPHRLPVSNERSLSELRDEILRGYAYYSLFCTYYAAHSIAKDLIKQFCTETMEDGIPMLGWKGRRLPYLLYQQKAYWRYSR